MAFLMRRLVFACVAAAVACRAAPTAVSELEAKVAQGLRLIEYEQGIEPVWMTEAQKLELLKADKNFFDVTDTYKPPASAFRLALLGPGSPAGQFVQPVFEYPAPSRQDAVKALIAQLSVPAMQENLANLTSFHNRFFTSETGAQASVWIRDRLLQISEANRTTNISVSLFEHSFPQSSIVARFPGLNDSGPLTVLGAHMDSVNVDDFNGPAPGADDDGSGTVNLMEAFRVLVTSGFQPATPVEFHWYAGEEIGLLGSQDISTKYKAEGVVVKGMLNLDMTAFVAPGSEEVIPLMPDFTNANLTEFLGSLVDEYSVLNWTINNPCGFACSDHASWDRNGYPTVLPFEGIFPENSNPSIHSTQDTTDLPGFSWNHTLEYTKLAVAFAFELAS